MKYGLFPWLLVCALTAVQLAVAEEKQPLKLANVRIEFARPPDAKSTVEERLEAKCTLQVEGATMVSFVEALEHVLDTSVMLSSKKIKEAAIGLDTPMKYRLRNVRLKTALKLILGDMDLSYLVQDNVLIIATPEDAGSRPVTRIYDCCDLLDGKEDSAQALFEVITILVAADSWGFSGPSPQADFKGLLVISQSQEVHEKIEKFLNQLHKARGLEGKVKVFR